MRATLTLIGFLLSFSFHAQHLIDVYCSEDSCSHVVIDPEMLIVERWDTLAQSRFWKTVINLSSDTCVVNVAETRQILGYIHRKEWYDQTNEEKKNFKD